MGIMCAGQVAALLACFSYQKIRGVFMIYRECGSEPSFPKRHALLFWLLLSRLFVRLQF